MLVHRRVTPNIKSAGTYLYTWVERGIVRVKCFAQEHNAMSQAKAWIQTAQPGGQRTTHEPNATPTNYTNKIKQNLPIIPHRRDFLNPLKYMQTSGSWQVH